MFITALKKSLPLGPTLSHNIQSTCYYRSPSISTLMLSSHQMLGLPKGSLLRPFLLFIMSQARHMLCQSHSSLLDHPMNRCWELRTRKLVVCDYLHPSVTFCCVDPNIHLKLCSYLSVKGHEQVTACNTRHTERSALVSAAENRWQYAVTGKAASILRTQYVRNLLVLVTDRTNR